MTTEPEEVREPPQEYYPSDDFYGCILWILGYIAFWVIVILIALAIIRLTADTGSCMSADERVSWATKNYLPTPVNGDCYLFPTPTVEPGSGS